MASYFLSLPLNTAVEISLLGNMGLLHRSNECVCVERGGDLFTSMVFLLKVSLCSVLTDLLEKVNEMQQTASGEV